MSQWTVLPASNLEMMTELLKAASWCKTQEMELVLAEAIKKHINPPMLFNGSNVESSKDD